MDFLLIVSYLKKVIVKIIHLEGNCCWDLISRLLHSQSSNCGHLQPQPSCFLSAQGNLLKDSASEVTHVTNAPCTALKIWTIVRLL